MSTWTWLMRARARKRQHAGLLASAPKQLHKETQHVGQSAPEQLPRRKCRDLLALLYCGIGRTIREFSLSETSPSLPLIRYRIFNCFAIPWAGSPKTSL